MTRSYDSIKASDYKEKRSYDSIEPVQVDRSEMEAQIYYGNTSRKQKAAQQQEARKQAALALGQATALAIQRAKGQSAVNRAANIDLEETQSKLRRVENTIDTLRQRGSEYDYNTNPAQYESFWRQVTDLEGIRAALREDVQLASEYKLAQDAEAKRTKERERVAGLNLDDLYRMREIYTRQQEANAQQKVQYDTISQQEQIDDIIKRDRLNQEQLDAVNKDIYYKEQYDKGQYYQEVYQNASERDRRVSGLKDRTYLMVNNGYDNENAYQLTNFMTNQERETYNIIVNQNGMAGLERGQKYLDYLEPALRERRVTQQSADIADYTNEHKVSGVLLNTAAGALKPLGYGYTIAQGMANRATNTYTPVDVNSPWFAGNTASEAATEGVTRDMSEAGKFLTNTGMSILSNLSLMGFGGTGALLIMGASSASDTARDIVQRGGSTEDAIIGGAAAGATEVLFEKVSLDNLISIKDSGTLKDIVDNILKQSGIEASEEAFTEITNTIADVVINKDNSNYEMSVAMYMAQGMSEEEARTAATKDVAKEVGLAMLSGGLSGGVMGAGGTVVGAASSVLEDRARHLAQRGAAIRESGNLQNLMDLAEEIASRNIFTAEGRVNAQRAVAKAVPSDRQVGKLAQEVDAAVAKRNAIEIRDQLRRADNQISRKESAKLARVIEAYLSGTSLSKRDIDTLKRSKTAEQVIEKLSNYDSSVSKRNLTFAAKKVGIEVTEDMTGEDIRDALTTYVMAEVAPSVSKADAKLASADDGQAYITESHKEVNIQGVADVKNGRVLLRLDDGSTVDATEVTYGTKQDAVLYESVVNMQGITVDDANALIKAFDPKSTSVEVYAAGIKEAFTYGTISAPTADLVLKNGFARMLSKETRMRAYNAGKKAADTVYNTRKAKNTKTSTKKRGGGKVVYDKSITKADLADLNEQQKQGLEAIKMLSKLMGNEWHIVKSYLKNGKRVIRTREGKEVAANGLYYNNGDIYIDIYAGNRGQGILLYTAAHELTHFIRQWSPVKFRALAEFLNEQYGNSKRSVAQMVALQQKKNPELSFMEAYEEFVADSMEKMLADGKVIEKLAELKQRDKTLWEKIKEFFTDLANKLKHIAAAYKDELGDTAESAAVSEMTDAIEQLQNLFAEGLYDASNTYQAFEEASIEYDNVKYSLKEFPEQVDDVLKGKDTSSTHLKVTDTPEILIECGLPNLPILLTAKHLKSIVADSGKNATNYHGLGEGIVKKLPESIADPVFIADSFTRNDSIVVVTEIINKNNIPVIAAIKLDGVGRLNKKHIRANILLSAYGKDNFQSYINRLIDNDMVIYWNKKKSQDLSVSLGIQFSNALTSLASDIIIRKAKSTVNIKNNYVGVKKGNLATPIDEQASINTPEANNGTVSTFKIAQVKPSVKNSLRSSDDLSSRDQLVNALIVTAKTDAERAKLEEYRAKVDELNALEQHLRKVNTEIKAISFSKGKRDQAALQKLRDEKVKTENRINIRDKQLLKIEASRPLKDLLDRETRRAVQRTEQKAQQALREQREESRKKIQDIVQRNKEAREKGVEGRRKTQMRQRILHNAQELRTLLVRGNKKRNIKQDQKSTIEEAVRLAEALFNNEGMSNAELAMTMSADMLARHPDLETYIKLIDKRYDLEEQLKQAQTDVERGKLKGVLDKVKREIYTLNRPLDEVFKGERRSRNETEVTTAIDKLAAAYEETKNSEYGYIRSAYNEDLTEMIRQLSEKLQGTIAKDMTLEQLNDVYRVYKMVLHSVRGANKAFAANLKETREQLAGNVMNEVEKAGGVNLYEGAIKKSINTYLWNNLKPVYAFEKIGSDTLMRLYNNIRAGEDQWQKDVADAKKFQNALAKKFGFDTWDFDKVYTFTSVAGDEFHLNLEQIMSIYAYSKRKAAVPHLTDGGIQIDADQTLKIGKKKVQASSAKTYALSQETIAEINKIISEDANKRMYVDLMQDYLSSNMGEKGNEVSMQLYGVELFGEENYFPLKVSPDFQEKAREQQDIPVRVRSYGFTNAVTPKARAPIVLSGFTNTWDNHVQEMSMYHALTLPMEDFYRVLNYKVRGEGDAGVLPAIKNAYGEAATKYINDLLKDVNGGVRIDDRMGFVNNLTSKYKKASVVASLSVSAQQPSSIGRAFALISPKYFIPRDTKSLKNEGRVWEEIKRYAPIAAIKEMGYFDTNMGRGFSDYIHAKEYSNIVEKAKGFVKDSNYRDEVLTKLPALMDELTWSTIWMAVKRETLATRKDLKLNSDAFLKHCGERFTEIISKTQVYDSVFSRSSFMRSKNPMARAMTAFLAEGTTTVNMLQDAMWKWRDGDRKSAVRTISAVLTSTLLNAVLVSFIYAMRDDDENETFFEKYMQSMVVELSDGLNPIASLPVLKDIWSVAQGYDVERSDMSLISDAVEAGTKLTKALADGEGVADAAWGVADTIGSFFGLPIKNVRRDVESVVNTVKTVTSDTEMSWGAMQDGLWESFKNSLPIAGWFKDKSKTDKLYDAIKSGDAAYVRRLKSSYKDESAVNSAIRTGLVDNEPRIKLAAEARFRGDTATYMKYARAILAEKKFLQNDIILAINRVVNQMTENTPAGNSEQHLLNAADYYNALKYGDIDTAELVKDELVAEIVSKGESEAEAMNSVESKLITECKNHYLEGSLTEKQAKELMTEHGGLSKEEAASKIDQWDFEETYGYAWGQRDRAYRLGAISENELISEIVKIEGVTRDEAKNKVRIIEAKTEYPDLTLDSQQLQTYYNKVESSGIRLDTYEQYLVNKNECDGKAEVCKMIDALPITDAQKDALYYLNGWAESTIDDAPWHKN